MKKVMYQTMITFLFLCVALQVESSEAQCDDCWSPSLSFDIENGGIEKTMVFISGYGYALNNASAMLSARNQRNYFCNEGKLINSRELVELLNETLSGQVTAEQASAAITYKLAEKYPCGNASGVIKN